MSTQTDRIFQEKVVPVMNKVQQDLQARQSREFEEHMSKPAAFLSMAAGPDGGASSSMAYADSVHYTGKWNSKTVEDYVIMVKNELKKQKVTVTPDIEKKMIDKMVNDRIPKSSIDYLLKKSAQSSLFYLPQEIRKSPMEQQLDAEAERRYNPSVLEKNAGMAIGSAADWLSTGGFGGGIKAAATWIGTDMVINHVIDKTNYREGIPSIVMPGMEEDYRKQQKKAQSANARKEPKTEPQPQQQDEQSTLPSEETQTSQENTQQAEPPEQTNSEGWNGLLTSFGLNGITDVTHNLGYVLAMLPDFLVGMFTGKSRMNIKDNLMPIASIAAGMFVRNPLLKMVLVSMGGLNLLNKAGHEQLDDHVGNTQAYASNYKVYPDQPLNSRISSPQLQGNCLIANIDRVPCTIALPEQVIDAYHKGALPLNTLANAVLAKNDQMQQMASQNYERNEQKDETRTLIQR